LSDATLSRDLLHEAYLRAANLSDANLSNAIGLTDEQIAAPRTAPRTLEGATMPDGQKYEDWLKDKKAQGEDG
jgi:uncharacterized protein YjbI with pentapeptide repeats